MVYYTYINVPIYSRMKIGSDVIMKIEKLSDKQIRCILDKSDLADRHLKISELAYGTEKAKELFREMMRQASYEFGFDAENIPLMIEAIPVSSECVVLVVTKVEDPEELDTRFSKFTPEDDYYYDDIDDDDIEEINDAIPDYGNSSVTDALPENNGADDVISLFNKVKEYLNRSITPVEEDSRSAPFIPFNQSLKNTPPKDPVTTGSSAPASPDISADANGVTLIRVFSFDRIDVISEAAVIVDPIYSDNNSLYKYGRDNRYYLVLEKGRCSPENFNRVCNVFTEFGRREHLNYASRELFLEHYDLIISGNAIHTLANI